MNRLEPDARAELAAELLASLDGPADADAEAAWAAEIDRRIEAVEAGSIRLEPWDTAYKFPGTGARRSASVLGFGSAMPTKNRCPSLPSQMNGDSVPQHQNARYV